MKCRSKNNKNEVAKEPHLTLKSSIAKMKKGEKLAEHRSKNSKNEVAKKRKGEKFAKEHRSKNIKNDVPKKQKVGSTKRKPLTEKQKEKKIRKQYVWWKINPCCVRKESIADFHGLSIHSKISHKKVLLVDNDVATDMDLRADEISGNKNGMA
ncbi:uncharacterized protein [Medicago truncatula]|uniref:uncharacterized protein n=1 Tax=Medicago truncatula TaxID=3880 RepID=UPI00196776C6|nr:uncharacterized protein LOC112419933 [Medicago truncatula]